MTADLGSTVERSLPRRNHVCVTRTCFFFCVCSCQYAFCLCVFISIDFNFCILAYPLPQSLLLMWPSTWSKPVWWSLTRLWPCDALHPLGRSSLSSGPTAASVSQLAGESSSLREVPLSPSSTWAATTKAPSGATRPIKSAMAPVNRFTSPSTVSI